MASPPDPFADDFSPSPGRPESPRSPRSNNHNNRKATVVSPSKPKSELSQAERTLLQQVRCTRIACGCSIFLCLLWPALMTAGIILMHTENPREEQLASLAALTTTYSSSRTAMQSTSGTLDTTTLEIEFDDRPVEGTTERSQFFQSIARIVMTENHGPNHGVVTSTMTYESGRRTSPIVESPPVKLTIPATYEAICTIGASSVCGTQTCCTPSAMQSKCQTMLHGQSTSSMTFVPTNPTCFLGETCGTCNYNQFLSFLCYVIKWDATNLRWTRDTSKNSCLYPFSLEEQQYADPNNGVTVFIRLSDDPFIIMQQLSSGTMELAETKSMERAGGRGMLLCAILVLLMLISLILMVHLCHFNVCDIIELRVMLGLPLSDRQVEKRKQRIAAKRDPDLGLSIPMTSRHTSSYLAQPQQQQEYNSSSYRNQRQAGDGSAGSFSSPLSATRRLDYSSPAGGPPPPPPLHQHSSSGVDWSSRRMGGGGYSNPQAASGRFVQPPHRENRGYYDDPSL